MSLLLLFRGSSVAPSGPTNSTQAEGQRTFLLHPTTSNKPIDLSTLLDVYIGDKDEIKYDIEEIRRRHLTIVLVQGEDVLYMPRKRSGTRCAFWKTEEEQCSDPLNVDSPCYNTGWIGGYHYPLAMKIVVPPTQRIEAYFEQGVRKEYQSRPWTIHIPRFRNRDMIIRKYTGERFEIMSISQTKFRGLTIHQEFDLRAVPRGKQSYMYAVPVPAPASGSAPKVLTNFSATGYAGAGANNAAIGGIAWSNPGNIVGPPDASVAQSGAGFVPPFHSNYLQASSFGFAIPSDATITGIQFDVNFISPSGGTELEDEFAFFVKGGTIDSVDVATHTFFTGNSGGLFTYGGPTTLGGFTWTPADINLATFGFVLSMLEVGATVSVDSIFCTVYYTRLV